jgi:Zn-finger nucleic acid-binding protein
MQLLCPKCHNVMAQYERNRVLVDQCTECKGIFLDRGELENLVAAERAVNDVEDGRPVVPPTAAPPPPIRDPYDRDPRHYGEHRYDERYYGRGYEQQRGYDEKYAKKKRRKSILEELLDF